jgi:hypothetical protein
MTPERIAEFQYLSTNGVYEPTRQDLKELLNALKAVTAERDAAQAQEKTLRKWVNLGGAPTGKLCRYDSKDVHEIHGPFRSSNTDGENSICELHYARELEARWRKMRKTVEDINCLWDNPAEPCVAGDECKRCEALRIANEGVFNADPKPEPEPCQECAKLRDECAEAKQLLRLSARIIKRGKKVLNRLEWQTGETDEEWISATAGVLVQIEAALTSIAAKPGGGE